MNLFSSVCIVGTGLMGGSLGLALKKEGFKGAITGFDTCNKSLQKARALGAIDEESGDLKLAVEKAELLVIAVPPGQFEKVIKTSACSLQQGAVVLDLLSVKGFIGEMLKKHLPQAVDFVGGHPMAGSEQKGVEAARSDLFEGNCFFLTPFKSTGAEAMLKIQALIRSLKAKPVIINPCDHDKVVSSLSHLPQFLAYVLVKVLSEEQDIPEFAGQGFRDMTRIASGDPDLWMDIFKHNQKELLSALGRLEKELGYWKELLKKKDPKLLDLLKESQKTHTEMVKGDTEHACG